MNAIAPSPLTADLRASLQARIERLLQRPLLARLVGGAPIAPTAPTGLAFFEEIDALHSPPSGAAGRWVDLGDGSARVDIEIDYHDRWRGLEKDVLDEVEGTREREVVLLTAPQARLLQQSPREFMDEMLTVESIELLDYETQRHGRAEHVVALLLESRPDNPGPLTHAAILPNLVPLQRQLAAIDVLERADAAGPLAPLRALLGLPTGPLPTAPRGVTIARTTLPKRLDATQRQAIEVATQTPHFATIQGPPGSGKTTVIATILQQALSEGQRVLVVSPTNVATDNVVEKLTADDAKGRAGLSPATLPIRYASKPGRILPGALQYWVGPKKQRRAATLARRLEGCLVASSVEVAALFAAVDPKLTGQAPLSKALSNRAWVHCGTPIGLLSSPDLREAAPAAFDLLIVDEVSKLTLPEFLAIAVYARRWVLVGDPQQLPPYNDACENGGTAEAVLGPEVELVCSVASVLERLHTEQRQSARLAVVANNPAAVAAAIEAQLQAGGLDAPPPVRVGPESHGVGVVVCGPDDLTATIAGLSPAARLHRGHNPHHHGTVRILAERGVAVPRPAVASGARLVEERLRACPALFEKVFDTYHAQPWAQRAGQKLLPVQFRKGLPRFLPTAAALQVLGEAATLAEAEALREQLLQHLANRFAANAVSVYDWLTGLPTEGFDVEPMTRLAAATAHAAPVRQVVTPYQTVLERQYRMHESLSRVPRALFYFGEALQDGAPRKDRTNRVRLLQVDAERQQDRTNRAEADRIASDLSRMAEKRPAEVLVITPYRDQERLLRETLAATELGEMRVEVCTLDRCQGREADFVIVSLVRPRATPFLDAPKRWNVALTRAKEGLFIYGNIHAYLADAAKAEAYARRSGRRPMMSLPSRFLAAYHRQAQGLSTPA